MESMINESVTQVGFSKYSLTKILPRKGKEINFELGNRISKVGSSINSKLFTTSKVGSHTPKHYLNFVILL